MTTKQILFSALILGATANNTFGMLTLSKIKRITIKTTTITVD